MEKQERPAHVLVGLERLRRPRDLLGTEAALVAGGDLVAVETEEEHVLVNEAEIRIAATPLPLGAQLRVGDVVIARHVVERHLQPLHDRLELAPLRVPGLRIFGVAVDEIADRHHEFRLQHVHLRDRVLEDARTHLAGAVAENRETKHARRVVHRTICHRNLRLRGTSGAQPERGDRTEAPRAQSHGGHHAPSVCGAESKCKLPAGRIAKECR
ncbi:MAG: hypothetical protein NVV63_04745 [Opitutus sp.]|nr:hypothetical protein [Opitutus sp.]